MARACAVLLSIGWLLTLTACSQLTLNSDFEPHTQFSSYHTWHWGQSTNHKQNAHYEKLDTQRIRSAISQTLPSLGLTQSTTGTADLWVHFYTEIEQHVRSHTTETGFERGYWPYRHGYHGSRYGVTNPHTTRYYPYQISTLVVEFIDTKTQAVIWQGTGRAPLQLNASAAERRAHINRTVQAVLAQYPER